MMVNLVEDVGFEKVANYLLDVERQVTSEIGCITGWLVARIIATNLLLGTKGVELSAVFLSF